MADQSIQPVTDQTQDQTVLGRRSEPLNILRISSDVYPEVVGGLGIHVHSLSREQAALGHDVTVLTSDHGDRSLPREEERSGYTVKRHREFFKPLDNSIAPGIARTLLSEDEQFDVVHAHSQLFFSTNLTAVLNNFKDAPLIVTNHGLMSQTAPRWLQRLFLPTVARYTFEAADCVLCYTDVDRERLLERNIDATVSIVSNGVDCKTFFPDETVDRKFQVLFVGRLKPDKGAGTVVDAFSELDERYDSLTLKMVGEGPQREELERVVGERGLTDRVSFEGAVAYDRMPQLYNESEVFVLPSLSEGMPRTVLEALACGVPAVTTDLPQLEPVLDGAGATVPPNSPERLASAVDELLADDDGRRRKGRTGRERILQHHNWEETVERTTNTYYDVLETF